MLLAAGIALILAFSLDNSQAQSNAAPAPPSTVPPPLMKAGPRQPPRSRGPQPVFSRAVNDLRMAKMQLQRSTNDFEGHRDAAIQACDKASEELEAIIKIAIAEQQKEQPPQAGQPPLQPSAPPAATPPSAPPQSPPAPAQP